MWQGFRESNNDFYFPENRATYREIQKCILQETAAMIGPGQGLMMGCINVNTSNQVEFNEFGDSL